MQQMLVQDSRSPSPENTSRTQTRSSSIRQKIHPKFYNRNQYFQSLPKFSMDQPCINNASPYIGNQNEQLRQEEIAGKVKWMSSDGFKTATSKKKEKYSQHFYVSADPSQPASQHKFRSEDKKSFLYGQFRVV